MTAKRFNLALVIVVLGALAGIGLWRSSPQTSAQGVAPVPQFRYRVESKTANFTAATVASEYNCDVSGGGFTATLPAAAGRTGLPLTFKVSVGGTGNVLVIDGNSSETIDGSTTRTLYEANDYLSIVSDGTNWKVIAEGQKARERVTANRTYYVDVDTGSDSNTGLKVGQEFASIQKAVDVCASLDWGGIYTGTIDVGDSTSYTATTALKSHNAPSITITGDTTTPANVLISTTSADCFSADTVTGKWIIEGVKMQTTTSGSCISAYNGSVLEFKNCTFGTTVTYHVLSWTASVSATGNYNISGGANIHWASYYRGMILCSGRTLTITGTPAFGGAFAYATSHSYIYCYGNTYSGSATGTRHFASVLSTVDTLGGGVTSLPGNAAGTPSAADTLSASGGLFH